MRARRTHLTTDTLSLPGGTEDNDLWYYKDTDDAGHTVIFSVWQPTDEERKRIADGENVRLLVWWNGAFPPLAMDITNEPLGRKSAELHEG